MLSTRGVLEARHQADVGAPLSARLLRVPYRSGTAFEAGAVLAEFDCSAMKADLAALQDAHRTLLLRRDSAQELFDLGAGGQMDVRLADSEAAQAAAEARAITVRLADCTVLAPWPGRVVERHVEAHETPQVGEPITSIVRTGSSEIVLIAPSAWLGWLRAGDAFAFTVDDTQESLRAEVSRLGATVDPVSQTVEVAARITSKHRARPGMSGTATFEPKP